MTFQGHIFSNANSSVSTLEIPGRQMPKTHRSSTRLSKFISLTAGPLMSLNIHIEVVALHFENVRFILKIKEIIR